jgi:hypothetical protein
VSALEVPQNADRWFAGHLPGRDGWLHSDLAEALAARASDLEEVLPTALGLAAASNPFIYDLDLAPFVRLAFPQAPTGYQPFGEAPVPAAARYMRPIRAEMDDLRPRVLSRPTSPAVRKSAI